MKEHQFISQYLYLDEDNHHVLVLPDPHCEYSLKVTVDLPLTLAGFVYSKKTAIVSGIAAWWTVIYGIQQIVFKRTKQV